MCIHISAQRMGEKDNITIEKSDRIESNSYNLYLLSLERSVDLGDVISEANALIRLDQPLETVYNYVMQKADKDKQLCMQILWNDEKNNKKSYTDALIRRDKDSWKNLCTLCNAIVDIREYEDYKTKILTRFYWRGPKIPERWDITLINILDTIRYNDQYYRNSINYLHKEEEWQKQRDLDLKNLIKIEKLLMEYGYPGAEKVGKDRVSTIWLVLHHQRDLAVRKKHESTIRHAVKEGVLDNFHLKLYIDRTNRIKLESSGL